MRAKNNSEAAFLSGGGEMGERIRAFDWSSTPLGPPSEWPQSLKSAVRIMLDSRYQMFVWWGPEFINFYNDAYRSALGDRHPHALGRAARDIWEDIWDTVGPQAQQVLYENQSTWHENQLLIMERYGFPEETFFSYSYSPVPSDEGGVGGVFCACTETTERVINERRLAALRQLASVTASAKTASQACELTTSVLHEHDRDVSLALIYMVEPDGAHARLCARTGVALGSPVAPERVPVHEFDGCTEQFWPVREVMAGKSVVVRDLHSRARLPGGPWPEPTKAAMLLPLKGSHDQPIGFIVLGASPRREFDDEYQGFFELIAGNLTSAITNARAYEEERKRAEELAALDRAKTSFFSNVSHELRTPLTLMLGPLEDILSREGQLPGDAHAQLKVAHRNSLRLLKLVNTLLDFSRIEAGRIEAHYEPTNLSTFTAELASVFRSSIEKAGLRLVIDCPALPEPVFVDREMWEKVVLNLISNAFKFTFEGEIKVSLRWCGERVEFSVADTGVGIPEGDIPKVFERFHRVRGSRSRTNEGTGIGLSLVQELAHLHGGEVKVQSREGHGSQFIVSIQAGKDHLPPNQIRSPRHVSGLPSHTRAFSEDTNLWLPDNSTLHPPPAAAISQPGIPKPLARILVADDNADMRNYIQRLLMEHFQVEAVPDGQAALESIRARLPDLVLTDVMMPRLDGFALLKALRGNEQTRTIPIIMLSARAGEESRVEGLDAGADDYLIKPFSARELIARVQSQLDLSKLRREGEDRVTRILDSITDGFHVVDAEGRFTELNSAARKMFAEQGIDVDAIIGRTVFEVFPDARNLEAGIAMNLALTGHKPSDVEVYYPPWKRWYFVRSRPMPAGGVATFFQDITERKLAESAQRRSEARFRAFVTASSDVVYSMSADWSEMRHLDGRQFIPDTGGPNRAWMQKYIYPEDQAHVRAAIDEAIRTKQPFELQHRVIRVDGTVGWIKSRAIPLLDEHGRITEWFGAATDVTDPKSAQDALQASEAHLELLSNTVPALISYVDTDRRYRSCNRTYTEWFGLPSDQVIGRTMREVLGDATAKSLQPHLEKAFSGQTVEFETEAKYRHGGTRWIHAVYTPHRDSAGRVLGLVILVTDVSERKRVEDDLRRSGERQRILSESLAYLLSSDDTENVVRELFPKVAAHLGVDTYFNFMVNEEGNALVLHSCAGIPEDTARSIRHLRFGEAICGTVAQTRTAIVANDIQNSDYDKAKLVRGFGIQCYACHPLMSGDRLLGTLSFASRTRPHFEESELEFLRVITNYVAIALERSRAMRALSEAQSRLELALRASGACTWGWNIIENKLDDWSPQYRDMYGFELDEPATFESWSGRIHPEDRPRLSNRVKIMLENPGDDTWNEEFRILHPGKGERWIGGIGQLFRDSSGRPLRMGGVNFDITARKQVELDLRNSQRALSDDYAGLARLHRVSSRFVVEGNFQELLAEIVDAAIAVTHAAKGNLQLFDATNGTLEVAAARGFSPTWLKYFNQVELSKSAACAHVLQRRERVIVEDVNTSDIFAGTSALAVQLAENVRAVQSTPLVSRTGELLGVVSTHFSEPHRPTERELHWLDLLARQAADVIERVRSEEALKKAQRELQEHAVILEQTVNERTARLRETVDDLESFSYSIAHDMRAPLRAMRGFSGILTSEYGEKFGETATDYLRRIGVSAERLDRLIQDVLNYSKVVRGDIPIEPVNAEKLIREIVESYPDFQEPHARIDVQKLPRVQANPAALTQVVSNLLGNSVKFVAPNVTPHIVVRAEPREDFVRLWFEDNGIGIPTHASERIFKMFQRLHPPGKYDGTGIGLAIIRKAVDRMGGRVGVDSEPGLGSRFWVELPKA